ncbi:MAG TPA: hypothetical protein VFZ58_00110 [Candidatus Saccharimonadales bacterium]
MSSPEAEPSFLNHIPTYMIEDGEIVVMMVPCGGHKPPMGPAAPVVSSEIPLGYKGTEREVRLLHNATATAYAVVSEDVSVQPDALEHSGEACICGFIDALQGGFDDTPEPSDEERGIEIGNIYAFALYCGLTEEQALICYNTAFCMTSRTYMNDDN